MIVKFVVFILMIKFGFRLLNSEIGNDHAIIFTMRKVTTVFSSP